jgi:DNA-binding transcriptional MerR regulator
MVRARSGPLTVGRVARACGLSRSALLYYDRLGLVSPSARSAAGYRLYSAADQARVQRIVRLREIGLGLDDVRRVLDARSPAARIIESHIAALGARIDALRMQQRFALRLIGATASARRRAGVLDKDDWSALLRAAGMSEPDMRTWHAGFERLQPQAHRDFLASLGLDAAAIARIRRLSRGAWSKAPRADAAGSAPAISLARRAGCR